jgi:hypothetical protein
MAKTSEVLRNRAPRARLNVIWVVEIMPNNLESNSSSSLRQPFYNFEINQPYFFLCGPSYRHRTSSPTLQGDFREVL